MRPPTPLSQRASKQLQKALKQAETKTEFQRVQCLWLREGEGALREAARGGRRRENLSKEAERQLLEGSLPTAAQGGVLEVKPIQVAYEAAVGHAVAKSTVYRMLARHGWRKMLSTRGTIAKLVEDDRRRVSYS